MSDRRESVTQAVVRLPVGDHVLNGDLWMPSEAAGVVLFAHGSGSSRHSPRNQYVAQALNQRHLATLLIDLLTPEEESIDEYTASYRFDIAMLADRLSQVVDWLVAAPETGRLPIGLFGASTGAAAALITAADRSDHVVAVVSRGGRPDLAGSSLPRVAAPSLLIVGSLDLPVIRLNREAMEQMRCDVRLEIVPGASHLFEERGALERVAQLAGEWLWLHVQSAVGSRQ